MQIQPCTVRLKDGREVLLLEQNEICSGTSSGTIFFAF